MDPKHISALAKLLRDNGDKVLTSEFKLSLSGPQLRALNDSFTLIADKTELCLQQSFQVVKPDNSKSEVFRDLQLIHDFIQKTLVLYITSFPDDNFDGDIDITKFRSLQILEIEKVNIKQIRGILQLRSQIQKLICIRCIQTVDDIITNCGGDLSNGFVWNELKNADFSYNNLRHVDGSLEFAQWLQHLNLSHNQLTNCEAIKWLPNLKVLNLSFNQLQTIPMFHIEASKRLQVLLLHNNDIHELNGLIGLDSLNDLDLSENCLLTHTVLLPISHLITLKYLNLLGNPLSHHPKHREFTVNYLNKNTATVKFVLDIRQLTNKEKSLTGRYNYNNYQTILPYQFTNNTSRSIGSIISSRQSQNSGTGTTPGSSIDSIKSSRLKLNNSSSKSMMMESATNLSTSIQSNKMKKPKVRTVEFPDVNHTTTNIDNVTENVWGEQSNISSKKKSRQQVELIGNQDHLNTKKQIQSLREQFGSGWLQNEKTSDVLGIQKTAGDKNSPNQSINDILGPLLMTTAEVAENNDAMLNVSTNKSASEDLLQVEKDKQNSKNPEGLVTVDDENSKKLAIQDDNKREPNKNLMIDAINEQKIQCPIGNGNELESGYESMVTSTPINTNNMNNSSNSRTNNLSDINDNSYEKLSENTTYESTYATDESNSTLYKTIPEELPENSTAAANKYHDFYENIHLEEPEMSDPEDNELNYIVLKKDSTEEMFLTVSDISIKEKNSLTNRTLTKWSLKVLQSCDRITSNTLRINFDTIKSDKQERIYTVEENLCQELERVLRDVLSKRPLCEMNQTVYRCIRCPCQFSTENSYEYRKKNPEISCPECKCKFVAEVLDSPKSVNIEKNSPIHSVVTANNAATTTATLLSNLLQETVSASSSSSATLVAATPTDKITTANLGKISSSLATATLITVPAATTTNLTNISLNNENKETNTGEKSLIGENASNSNNSSIGKGKRKLSSKTTLSSIGSLNESSSCSKIFNSQSSFDSNQSVAGSSSNERDKELNENVMLSRNYCDSDVEILSNPSQSSIEVLEYYQYQTSRKTSEERRISRIPSLETIEDNCMKISDEYQLNNNLGGGGGTLVANESNGLSEFLQNEIKQNSEERAGAGGAAATAGAKKFTIGPGNLTESSSSGSVADSICTTYEQQDFSNVNNDIKRDSSFISSVFNGLFQSTNILMSRSQKSNDNNDDDVNIEKFKYNYVNFSEIDHRLKLYFYQFKFVDVNEQFKWLIKGKIFMINTKQFFDGMIVMSSSKIYLMQSIGPETFDISKWLKQVFCSQINRPATIQILPFKTGLEFTFHGSSSFLLILQDILRTDNLLLYFANNPLPSNFEFIYQVSDNIMKKFATKTDNRKLEMFSVLNSCTIHWNDDMKTESPSCIFLTDSKLYLTRSNLLWLSASSSSPSNSEFDIEILQSQQMSNLIEYDHEPLSDIFALNFYDETGDKFETWKCAFETKENTESCLASIGNSWQKLFDVPITNKFLCNQ